MVKVEDIIMLSDSKTSTKQIPLFEEEEDGNLIPYTDEDWIILFINRLIRQQNIN